MLAGGQAVVTLSSWLAPLGTRESTLVDHDKGPETPGVFPTHWVCLEATLAEGQSHNSYCWGCQAVEEAQVAEQSMCLVSLTVLSLESAL